MAGLFLLEPMRFISAILAPLLFAAPALAGVTRLYFGDNGAMDVKLAVSLPTGFYVAANTGPGTALTHFRYTHWVRGGLDWVDGSGLEYSPPIAPTGISPFPGCFAVMAADSAAWEVSFDGTLEPGYYVVGSVAQITGDLEFLGIWGEYDLSDELRGVPFGPAGSPVMETGAFLIESGTLDDPIPLDGGNASLASIDAPEPSGGALAAVVAAALILRWRKA